MSNSSLSPLSVVEYSSDFIIDFVRYMTGWNERDEVSEKAQLVYLCNYLNVDHIACKTIVVESDYVDRNYLEDYAEYYARCFPDHPRKCSRLHFFSQSFTESQFREYVSGKPDKSVDELIRLYIGFVVIRPIPHTVFARICLRPYEELKQDSKRKILTREIDVSIFGLKLTVETVPFIEQDKVVSACATSALWVSLGARKDISLNMLPSSSTITKAARSGGSDSSRTFPTDGLSPPHILRALQHFGMEPNIVWADHQSVRELQALVYSYLSSDSSLILGGKVYQRRENETEFSLLGLHLVCVTGYALNPDSSSGGSGQKFRSDDMHKIYVHDDRCGPYLKVSTEMKRFVSPHSNGVPLYGMESTVEGHSTQMFVPNIAIVGLYHKIRIPYHHIYQTCSALYFHLSNILNHLRTLQSDSEDTETTNTKKLANAVCSFVDGSWEISLVVNNDIKKEIISSKNFFSFNGSFEKEAMLMQNMPRFLWRCRIFDARSSEVITEILFDATELPQGAMMVGYVSRTPEAQTVWIHVENCVQNRIWRTYGSSDPMSQENSGCFTKFFSQQRNSANLNILYGPLRLPSRPLKLGETDAGKNIQSRGDTYKLTRGEQQRQWSFLDPRRKYIWVIDAAGDIVIGEDINSGNVSQGHPTLIDGKPARSAGELYCAAGDHVWTINLRSGRYSSHVEDSERSRHLEAVLKYNLSGLTAKIEMDRTS